MTDVTDRLALPLLSAGQAQKELYHNEALARIDVMLCGAVVDSGHDTPPADPDPRGCWIVGNVPTGAWTSQANALAGWTSGGWRFVTPRAGMNFWHVAQGVRIFFDGSAWISGVIPASSLEIGGVQVVGARQAAIPDPAGGTTIDAEARSGITTILEALRSHGLISS